jgi:hypothetical protein
MKTTAIAAILCLVTPAPAAAIPWDIAGAIPPSKTGAPRRPDPLCLQSYANDPMRGGPALRLGIGPLPAGEGGTGNATPLVPQNPSRRDRALAELKGHRYLAVRLNRLFMSNGTNGIREYQRLAKQFTRHGIDVELQVRYHPAPADNGNITKWLAFVRKVVRAFGPNRRVTALQITNEVNLDFSPNTSDGYYRNAARALVDGVIAAKRQSLRLGYRWQQIGFNYAWRDADFEKDARFWRDVGKLGGQALRRATDYVGVDIYPGTFTPGILLPNSPPIQNHGDAWLEGIAQLRKCYMPKAGFERSTPIRIEETGYPTGPGRPEAAQARALSAFVHTAVDYRGTYNITDFNWFNLRDNNSRGPNFQSYFGLLRDNYSPKPAFGVYRRLIALYGAKTGPSAPGACPRTGVSSAAMSKPPPSAAMSKPPPSAAMSGPAPFRRVAP